MYNLNTKKQRRAGLGRRDRPTDSLLTNFRRSPSSNPEPHVTKTTKGDSAGNGSSAEEDEISSYKAPSVSTSPRGARIRRRPVSETNHGSGMHDHDDFVDIDNFATPVQVRVSTHGDEDINQTTWKSQKKEHDEETQRLLRAKNSTRVNPQHVSGAAFDVGSVRQTPGASWDKGPSGKKKSKTTYGRKPVVRPRPGSQIIESLDTDGESEDEDELQSLAPKTSVTHTKTEFKDPTKLYVLPPKEEVQPRPFRDPMLVYPLPPRVTGGQGANDSGDADLLKPQSKRFRDSAEKFKMHKKESGPAVTENPKAKAFVDPFTRKYGVSSKEEEPESQSQAYYVDDSTDEIASIGRGSDTGGSRKRKASSTCPKVGAIDLSTPRVLCRGNKDLPSSPNGVEYSIGGSQSSTISPQFPSPSSQVRHMDDISLGLRETKLREQGKRKKMFETADVCVLCAAVLPLGVLDTWKDEVGELRPIRMAEWTEICNSHKAADLQKEWEEKGYPVIEWKGLKKRVGKHHEFLVGIVENKVPSPFREVFAKQQKEIRGNAALLLRKDHQLQYPGYYGPRGSGILLHEITVRLASFVGDAGKKDRLIAQGGVAAFIQTVLVPELGVRLIMEDMNVRETKARAILDESREIGEKLNMDEFTDDIYDEEDGPWFDINAKTPG